MTATTSHQALQPEFRLLVLLVSIGFFMQGLDTTIVNTAIPSMAAHLHEDPLNMHSVVVAYVLSAAACIPLSGWLADRFVLAQGWALAAVLFSEPDLLLLDLMLPGLAGEELIAWLRAEKMMPVIVLSAHDQEMEKIMALDLGANDYITKPFRSSLVRNRVANQLKYKRYRDHLNDMVHERTRQLALTQEATIHAMATLAEWRDTETGAHIKRTQNYVKALVALHMANLPQYRETLNADAISWLYLSAPLHDVGKVSIPDAILLKPGKLTVDEFEIMKTHTTLGRRAIEEAERRLGMRVAFLTVAKEIAYSHQEKWDGSGYPEGLRGDAIPVSARLMALADVYDALISRRVYKPAFSHEQACAALVKGRGTHFDPDIVDAFMEIAADFWRISQQYPDPPQ